MRNAADKSTTQPTFPTSAGAMAMLASWGRPRNTTSRPVAAATTDERSDGPKTSSGYRAATLGYRSATRVPAWVSPVAMTSSRPGWPAMRRISSTPVYPEAPMMPARRGAVAEGTDELDAAIRMIIRTHVWEYNDGCRGPRRGSMIG